MWRCKECQQPEAVINTACMFAASDAQPHLKLLLPPTGNGAEAAIGQLTCLTSLTLYVGRRSIDMAPADSRRTSHWVPQQSRGAAGSAFVPLQLQLLGCNRAASAAGSNGGVPGCNSSAGSSPAMPNTGLQELSLYCSSWLSDDELAAAAAALSDLRSLKVGDNLTSSLSGLSGLRGAGLAAFSACRRLRDISLDGGADLEGQQLVAQLPQIASLTSVELIAGPGVNGSTLAEVQAAFQAKHGRQLSAYGILAAMGDLSLKWCP